MPCESALLHSVGIFAETHCVRRVICRTTESCGWEDESSLAVTSALQLIGRLHVTESTTRPISSQEDSSFRRRLTLVRP